MYYIVRNVMDVLKLKSFLDKAVFPGLQSRMRIRW
jgi:hypothetical protein